MSRCVQIFLFNTSSYSSNGRGKRWAQIDYSTLFDSYTGLAEEGGYVTRATCAMMTLLAGRVPQLRGPINSGLALSNRLRMDAIIYRTVYSTVSRKALEMRGVVSKRANAAGRDSINLPLQTKSSGAKSDSQNVPGTIFIIPVLQLSQRATIGKHTRL